MKLKKSGRLGDPIEVVSTFRRDSAYRGHFSQRLECCGETLVQTQIDVVCIDDQ